jgi:hypothetical protein
MARREWFTLSKVSAGPVGTSKSPKVPAARPSLKLLVAAEIAEILIISHEGRNSHYDAITRRDSTRSIRSSSCESSPMRERLS